MYYQVQDYLEAIQKQVTTQVRKLVKKPTRSLSAGGQKVQRELISFANNQEAYIRVFNHVLDSYIRVRSAFQAMDELWIFLLEYAYPQLVGSQAGPNRDCLFEALNK